MKKTVSVIIFLLFTLQIFPDKILFCHAESFEIYENLILSGFSYTPKEIRQNYASVLEIIDTNHLELIEENGYSFEEPDKIVEQIMLKTEQLPDSMPMGERTIIYLLYMQIEILDSLLYELDRTEAGNLRNMRNSKRIMSDDGRIYNDYRDIFINILLDTLKDINFLQKAFGSTEEINFDYPFHLADDKSEIPDYIEEKMMLVAEESALLLK